MKVILFYLFTLVIISFFSPTQVYAQEPAWNNCQETVGGTNVATLKCIPVVFKQIINWALAFAGIVAFFFIVLIKAYCRS